MQLFLSNLLCMHNKFLYIWNHQPLNMKERTIDYILRTTWLTVQKMYNEEAAKFESTMATGFTLLSIDPEKGTPSTALGPKMGMEATSLSRILKTMEKRGLIERHPNPEDGRGVIIKLTDFGLKKRDYSKERVLTFNQTIKNNITEEKLNHFYEVADLITDMVTNKKIFTQNDK